MTMLAIMVVAAPTRAECTEHDAWPSFSAVAPAVRTVVIGTVAKVQRYDSADFAIEFDVSVSDVLRGDASATTVRLAGFWPGGPRPLCGVDSILRTHLGDELALASNGDPNDPRSISAVAFVSGPPDMSAMPRMETLTASEIRSILDLPPSDANEPPILAERTQALPAPALLFILFLGIAFAIAYRRARKGA